MNTVRTLVLLFFTMTLPLHGISENSKQKTVSFGGGCFWCTEACFEGMRGVESVQSGYQGGKDPAPTYEKICTGVTGHAEVIRIVYNPDEVSFDRLLDLFFTVHDPTTLNRQGADYGTQYRSVIFPSDEAQREAAVAKIKELNEKKVYGKPVVTTVEPWSTFHPAEGYHQDYFRKNPNKGYCRMVIAPKVRKAEASGLKN